MSSSTSSEKVVYFLDGKKQEEEDFRDEWKAGTSTDGGLDSSFEGIFPAVSGVNCVVKLRINAGDRPFKYRYHHFCRIQTAATSSAVASLSSPSLSSSSSPLWSGANRVGSVGIAGLRLRRGDLGAHAAAMGAHWNACKAMLASLVEKKLINATVKKTTCRYRALFAVLHQRNGGTSCSRTHRHSLLLVPMRLSPTRMAGLRFTTPRPQALSKL